ncbi:MAG: hypothetical protein WKG00_19530 [Polyangiaceae bacterium]
MKRVLSEIAARQREFANHPFFQRLERNEPTQRTMAFISAPAFFVMAFQDILRLNATRIQDPQMRRVAERHQQEDLGHDSWYLHDVAVVEGDTRNVSRLFAPEHMITRDVSYELISEAWNATDDRVRIVLVLVLEATGHVMFRKVSQYLERMGFDRKLKYFSKGHLDVELDHEIFESVDAELQSIVLAPEARDAALGVVERGFAAQARMLDGFNARIDAESAAAPQPN